VWPLPQPTPPPPPPNTNTTTTTTTTTQVLYIGIPCFTEHPDEIIPTIESILRNGGDDSLKVHVVLCADVSIDPVTKQRVDAVPFGATWKRNDGRFTFTFLNKGLKAFTGKTSSLYLINKVSVCVCVCGAGVGAVRGPDITAGTPCCGAGYKNTSNAFMPTFYSS
jgi:hypothetical protein